MTDDPQAPLFLQSTHETSGRSAVIDEVAGSVWLFLTSPGSQQPERDCWLANTVGHDEQQAMDHYRALGLPPPAAPALVESGGVVTAPSEHAWDLRWSADGESVAAICDGEVRGFVCATSGSSRARFLNGDGPWGLAWDQAAFDQRFA